MTVADAHVTIMRLKYIFRKSFTLQTQAQAPESWYSENHPCVEEMINRIECNVSQPISVKEQSSMQVAAWIKQEIWT